MKRYMLINPNGWMVITQHFTILEAVEAREQVVGGSNLIIAETIPAIEAYAMAKREQVVAELKAAYGK